MNKLILIVLMLLSVGAYAQDGDSTEMRKGNFSMLVEAELAPNTDYKTRGMSLNVVHNTIDDQGKIVQHSTSERKQVEDNEFCMPLYITIKCVLCKRTNASPFFEFRVGKDVAYDTNDLYRAFIVGSRFGFNKNYRHAVNVAMGLQLNPVDDLGSATFLFKVGYEF